MPERTCGECAECKTWPPRPFRERKRYVCSRQSRFGEGADWIIFTCKSKPACENFRERKSDGER